MKGYFKQGVVNLGREKVAHSLGNIIEYYFGKENISERNLRNAWLEDMSHKDNNLTFNGWYDPPENGVAMLTCDSNDVRRSHFRSFRDKIFFVNDKPINWNDVVIMAYASNLDINTGIPADFATTIYYGDNNRYREYFTKCFRICHEVIEGIHPDWIAKELYLHAHNIFANNGMDGKTWSSTDNEYNYGHTLPSMFDVLKSNHYTIPHELSYNDCKKMRDARKFISESTEWKIKDNGQFTIEPQCIIPNDLSLPKVMIHYVAKVNRGNLEVCRSCEILPRKIGLL